MEQKKKIFCQAEELFLKYGVKSVTMDDLASHLGVSKKTLYQHFTNKSDLIEKTLSEHLNTEKNALTALRKESENALEELEKLGMHVGLHLQKLNPSIIFDLKRYYPKAWAIVEQYKVDFIYQNILENINRGKREEIYRADLNPEIIARIYLEMVDMIIHVKFEEKQFETVECYQEFLRYHIRGIASEKGRKVLEKINSNNI